MRAGVRALAVVAAAVLALSGCGVDPVAGDGDIGGDWAVLPEAKVPTPDSGVCRPRDDSDKIVDWTLASFLKEPPVACAGAHVTETIYVGRLPSSEDDKTTPPEPGDAVFKVAYNICGTKATSFLGADFHGARIAIVPVMPIDLLWQGGARWYRCELVEIADMSQKIVERTSSAKDGLRGSKPLALTCADDVLTADKKFVTNVTFLSCDKPHYVEYTGAWVPADGPYPGKAKQATAKSENCFRIGAGYLGMSVSGLHDVGGISWDTWGGSELMWSVGDRGVRCFMGPFTRKKRTGSIKGKSPKAF